MLPSDQVQDVDAAPFGHHGQELAEEVLHQRETTTLTHVGFRGKAS